MKKFFLIFGLSVFSLAAFAEGIPSVSVNKSQGGWTAILNMYNYVSYTPAESSPDGIAQLNCSGNGFSFCRIPNCTSITVSDGSEMKEINDISKVNTLVSAINNVIDQLAENNAETETNSARRTSTTQDVKTKKVAISNPSAKNRAKCDTYVVKGVSSNNRSADTQTVKIYIDKVDLLGN